MRRKILVDGGIRRKAFASSLSGTGGAALYDFLTRAANSERQYKGWGVLKMTLLSESYQWDFVPIAGASPDSGSGTCH